MVKDDNKNKINRRDVLRNTATASAISLSLASMSNSAAAEGDVPDFEIVSRTELSDAEVRKEVGHMMDSTAIENIDQAMREESAVESAGQFGIAFETDDPEINETDPAIIFSGYESSHPGRTSAGMLVSIIVDATPDAETSSREPMMAFGRTVEETASGTRVVTSSADGLELKTFTADRQGSASVSQHDPLPRSATVGSGDVDGGVTTQDWRDELGCGACTAIVTTLCEGATGSVSRTACLQACAPFLGSVWGYGACGAACFVIVDTINNYGCAVGAGTICAAMDLC